jgi:NAD-dependent SIR2 family protein deacetylase
MQKHNINKRGSGCLDDNDDNRASSETEEPMPEESPSKKHHDGILGLATITATIKMTKSETSNILSEMAEYILSPECKSILVLIGAGASVASGIPDFRSPGTGLYATLESGVHALTATADQKRHIQTEPTFALSKDLFLENSLPLLELLRPLILGTQEQTWKATIVHRFVELLHQNTNNNNNYNGNKNNSKLTRLYTQNIDGLEHQCKGLPADKVIQVHGSLDRAICLRCGTAEKSFDDYCNRIRTNIQDLSKNNNNKKHMADNEETEQTATAMPPPVETETSESEPIPCHLCGYAAVKPTVILFGEDLPLDFAQQSIKDTPHADLLIIIGTSLAVAPVNFLVPRVPPTTRRLVVNNVPVGSMLGIDYTPRCISSSSNTSTIAGDTDRSSSSAGDEENNNNRDIKRDFFAQGLCEETILELIERLGWIADLRKHIPDLPASSAQLVENSLLRVEQTTALS